MIKYLIMVKCEICGNEFKKIDKKHLETHNYSKKEYKIMFPNAKLSTAWNKGLTKEIDERVLKNSLGTEKNHWSKSKNKRKEVVDILKEKCGREISEDLKRRFSKDYKGKGNPNYGNNWTEEQKKEQSKKMKIKFQDPDYMTKFLNSHWSNNEEMRNKIGRNHSIFMSEAISSGKINLNTGFKQGYFKSKKMQESFYFMSSYEEHRMELLENSDKVIKFTNKHKIRIPYKKSNGKIAHYIPDILVTFADNTLILEEIKGRVRDVDVFERKKEAAENYCKKNGMIYKVIFKNGLEDI